MMRLRWELTRAVRVIGLPGWVGLALLLAGAAIALGVALPLRADAERLVNASAALELRLPEQAAAHERDPSAPPEQLADFKGRFIPAKALSPALVRLQGLARKQGIALDQGEFRFSSDAGEPLARYAMVLPVKADYRALRRFLHDAMREFPGLAIEEINLRRSDPKVLMLEAQLRLVLFVAKPD